MDAKKLKEELDRLVELARVAYEDAKKILAHTDLDSTAWDYALSAASSVSALKQGLERISGEVSA